MSIHDISPPARLRLDVNTAPKKHYAGLWAAVAVVLVPRVAVAAAWYSQSWFERVFGTDWVWPLAGAIAFPWTCLAYAWSMASHGAMSGLEMALIVLGLVLDILSLSLVKASLSKS